MLNGSEMIENRHRCCLFFTAWRDEFPVSIWTCSEPHWFHTRPLRTVQNPENVLLRCINDDCTLYRNTLQQLQFVCRVCWAAARECSYSEWRCVHMKECISLWKRCDGSKDCYDWSDEQGCGLLTDKLNVSLVFDIIRFFLVY